MNNWAPPENGVWRPAPWDPTYPKYPLPAGIAPGTDQAYATKQMMITRYVTEYNQSLSALAAAQAARVMLIRTEALNDETTAARLRMFVGQKITMPSRPLNVGNNAEGAQPDFWY